MPRRARLVIPGLPFHVTQRGVNRCAIFVDDEDRRTFLRLLRRRAAEQQLAVHAYVLMDNHVHLLATPGHAGSLSGALRRCGQVYVQYFNSRWNRSGALWQGRFASSPVQSDRHLLLVQRYIDLNPVRAGMVRLPEEHAWSSVHCLAGRRPDPLVTPHEIYLSLGNSTATRVAAYAGLLAEGLEDETVRAIRRSMTQQRAFGTEQFGSMMERTLGLPARCRGPGRPRVSSRMDSNREG